VFADRGIHPLPSLVFLDLKLPRVMGMDVLKWIRAQPAFATMVVIILTSSQLRSDITLAYQLGANSYLVKPSNPLDLSALVEAIKQYWLTFNQPTIPPLSLGERRGPRPRASDPTFFPGNE